MCDPTLGQCDTPGEWKQLQIADGTNCLAGTYPLGIDGLGNVQACTVDDDVPENGDFGNAVGLNSDGSVKNSSITAANMANADHGDISWSGGVASVDANSIALGTDTTGNYVGSVAVGNGLDT